MGKSADARPMLTVQTTVEITQQPSGSWTSWLPGEQGNE